MLKALSCVWLELLQILKLESNEVTVRLTPIFLRSYTGGVLVLSKNDLNKVQDSLKIIVMLSASSGHWLYLHTQQLFNGH